MEICTTLQNNKIAKSMEKRNDVAKTVRLHIIYPELELFKHSWKRHRQT